MKKSILGAAIALSIVGLAACTEEAKASPAVTIYGQVEQSVSTGSNKNLTDDNLLGFSVSESLNEAGDTAFAKIEFGVDDETDAVTNRETYVGVTMSDITAQVGRMKNLKKSMVNGVDAFQGTSFSVDGAARADDVAMISTTIAGVTVSGATVLDGTANADEVGETRELGAAVELGGLKLAAVATKAGSADTTVVMSAGVEVADADVSVSHEPDATNKTTTGVATMDLGSNTLRGGYSYVDGADNTMIAEVAHNFSKSTSVFVNHSKTENADAVTSVGIAMAF
jgi:hypothetical protein